MLELTQVACARGGVPVLTGVSFTLSAGEVLLLRGPNGIGKTTLLRTIAGLQPPQNGRIEAAPDSIAYGAHADGIKAQLTVVSGRHWMPSTSCRWPTAWLRTSPPGRSGGWGSRAFW